MPAYRELASGLEFPEGPVAMPDGSVLVTEIFGPCITRVTPDGRTERVAEVPGGPNGCAIGPDGAAYVTNNGGSFSRAVVDGKLVPGAIPDTYRGGSIDRVDLATGEVTTLYRECGGHPLRSPNDLVFDALGGMWFTDHGIRQGRSADRTGIYYAQPDGSAITEVVFPVDSPNGIALSPDGGTLYWAETHTGRVWRREVAGPGVVLHRPRLDPWACLIGLPGLSLLDSMAVDSAGNVCVATLVQNAGITVVSPEGELVEQIPFDDPFTTNICFGGPDLRTAYVTLASTGRLVAMEWPRPGLKLAF